MPRELAQYTITDFSGGLNTARHPSIIKDSEASVATGIFLDKDGGPQKRYGYITHTTLFDFSDTEATEKFGIFSYSTNSSAETLIVCNGLYSQRSTNYTTAAGTWSYIAYTGGGGTATFTNSATTVSRASGTAEWTSQVKAGDKIRPGSSGSWLEVSSVTNDSTIILTVPYTGATDTTSYQILQKMNNAWPDGVMFKNKLYFGPATDPNTGTSGLLTWDGTETRRVASTTRLDRMVVHKNYIFGFLKSGASNLSRLYWSASLDPTSWPAANFIDVSPDDGTTLQGLFSFNDVLYLFKDNSIWYLVGEVFDTSNPTYALRRIVNPDNVGTMHGKSVRAFNGSIIFLGRDGIFALEGVSKITNISRGRLSRDDLDGAITNSNSNDPSISEVFDDKYWLAIPGTNASSFNTVVYTLDKDGAWSFHNLPMKAMRVMKFNIAGLAWNRYDSAEFNWMDTTATNDGSGATTGTWRSKLITFGDFTKTTHVIDVFVAFKNTTSQAATVKVYDDSGLIGSGSSASFTGGSTKLVDVVRVPVERDVNGLRVEVTDSTASSSFTMLGVTVTYVKQNQGSGKVVT